MPKLGNDENGDAVYRAKVTGRHAITLPADVCRTMGVVVGDMVEIRIDGRQAFLSRVEDGAIPPLRGILRDYFSDRDDVQRFISEERSGWEEGEGG